MTDSTSAAVVNAIQQWHADLPIGLATLSRQSNTLEEVLRITPASAASAWVEFRIAPYGKMDILFGNAGSHEEVDSSPEVAIQVCEAARLGRVTEETRTWRGHQLYTRTVMHLPNGVRLQSTEILPLGLLPLGHMKRRHFVPWDEEPSASI
jgi:hypothetical protein